MVYPMSAYAEKLSSVRVIVRKIKIRNRAKIDGGIWANSLHGGT